ncbi:MAG: hypothetical protein ACETV1_05300 [Candidatus Bathyarchaeia archaeon]
MQVTEPSGASIVEEKWRSKALPCGVCGETLAQREVFAHYWGQHRDYMLIKVRAARAKFKESRAHQRKLIDPAWS